MKPPIEKSNEEIAELLVENIWNEKNKKGQAYPRKHEWKHKIAEALDAKDDKITSLQSQLTLAKEGLENIKDGKFHSNGCDHQCGCGMAEHLAARFLSILQGEDK